MKKILIFTVCEDIVSLDLAIENIKEGNEVYLLQCDKKLGYCQYNVKGNCLLCRLGHHSMKKIIKELRIDNKVNVINLSDVVNKDDEAAARKFDMDFNNVQDLKNLTYKGAQVGYGAFSSYVTFSGNVTPEFTPDFKKYIWFLIRKEIMIYHALERLHRNIHFDQIIFHNGRFAQFKPLLEFARLNHIDYVATEVRVENGKTLKDLFYNDIPHSISYLAKNVIENWEKGDPQTREQIGRSFFEKRKAGKAAGDKAYVKDQHKGELPEAWDEELENIAIFNSSEDEFCSISIEYDKNLLYPSQYDALRDIFEHYKDDKTKHFYLRIHPRLKDFPFKFHLELYNLKYDNVTIIPADSPISSYSLLDNSDKIIIFNSTMGVEAAYWGKPVISLTKYIYWELGMLFHPNTPEELWKLIDNKNLKIVPNDNIIKYGYWLLKQNYPAIGSVPCYHVEKVFGHKLDRYTIMRLLKSYKLYVLVKVMLEKINLFTQFNRIPGSEPYIITR